MIGTFKVLGYDPDYKNYHEIITNIDSIEKQYEIGFIIISKINNFFFKNSINFVYFIFLLLSLSLKIKVIKEFSNNKIISCYIYLTMFFLIQDYTQIRASVSVGIFLLSIQYIYKNKVKYFALFLISLLFHWSSIIFILIYIIIINIKKIEYYFFILIIFILLNLFPLDIEKIFQNRIIINILPFIGHQYFFNVFNLLNLSLIILDILLLLLYFKYRKYISEYNVLLLKIFTISQILYLFFGMLGLIVLSYRLSSFLNIVIIILLPNILKLIKDRKILFFLIIIYFTCYFFYIYKFVIFP